MDLAFDSLKRPQHLLCVGHQGVIVKLMSEVLKRASDIAFDDIKELLRLRRMTLYLEAAVNEDGADLRRGHQVLQIAVGVPNFLNLLPVLLVYRGKFFVDRL